MLRTRYNREENFIETAIEREQSVLKNECKSFRLKDNDAAAAA